MAKKQGTTIDVSDAYPPVMGESPLGSRIFTQPIRNLWNPLTGSPTQQEVRPEEVYCTEAEFIEQLDSKSPGWREVTRRGIQLSQMFHSAGRSSVFDQREYAFEEFRKIFPRSVDAVRFLFGFQLLPSAPVGGWQAVGHDRAPLDGVTPERTPPVFVSPCVHSIPKSILWLSGKFSPEDGEHGLERSSREEIRFLDAIEVCNKINNLFREVYGPTEPGCKELGDIATIERNGDQLVLTWHQERRGMQLMTSTILSSIVTQWGTNKKKFLGTNNENEAVVLHEGRDPLDNIVGHRAVIEVNAGEFGVVQEGVRTDAWIQAFVNPEDPLGKPLGGEGTLTHHARMEAGEVDRYGVSIKGYNGKLPDIAYPYVCQDRHMLPNPAVAATPRKGLDGTVYPKGPHKGFRVF